MEHIIKPIFHMLVSIDLIKMDINVIITSSGQKKR